MIGGDIVNKIYMCIDLKSFYASVECRERGLDPLDTNLVVADESRTDKTICLAVSPSLKSYGLSGRCRLFEAKQKAKEVNYHRRKNNHYKPFIKNLESVEDKIERVKVPEEETDIKCELQKIYSYILLMRYFVI